MQELINKIRLFSNVHSIRVGVDFLPSFGYLEKEKIKKVLKRKSEGYYLLHTWKWTYSDIETLCGLIKFNFIDITKYDSLDKFKCNEFGFPEIESYVYELFGPKRGTLIIPTANFSGRSFDCFEVYSRE